LEPELTDLRFIVVQKPGYSILLLQVDLPQELGAPEVVVVVALYCLGAPPRRRHLAW
jgi:hypothetical protein